MIIITGRRGDIEYFARAVSHNIQRDPGDPVRSKIIACGIEPKHAVRVMDSRVYRDQQMAYITDIRIHIIDRILYPDRAGTSKKNQGYEKEF